MVFPRLGTLGVALLLAANGLIGEFWTFSQDCGVLCSGLMFCPATDIRILIGDTVFDSISSFVALFSIGLGMDSIGTPMGMASIGIPVGMGSIGAGGGISSLSASSSCCFFKDALVCRGFRGALGLGGALVLGSGGTVSSDPSGGITGAFFRLGALGLIVLPIDRTVGVGILGSIGIVGITGDTSKGPTASVGRFASTVASVLKSNFDIFALLALLV